jgi:Ca2+-binding RTX toxin-like protein
VGRAGDDVLRGRSGDDRLRGGRGADLLDGGPGLDLADAGAGDDVVRARDGRPDRVVCGPGRDRVVADRTDRLAPGCELVRRG